MCIRDRYCAAVVRIERGKTVHDLVDLGNGERSNTCPAVR